MGLDRKKHNCYSIKDKIICTIYQTELFMGKKLTTEGFRRIEYFINVIKDITSAINLIHYPR